uniref:Major intrinsically disordered Notch2-binding receptor 1 n=1 Tax=Geotrypetes seraphini TaxID=260995 RepID=A0A6P8PMK3_GEOSA|nr:major intrinsically disordered Notch2-binding receptor 1 [Geotrypetes seraphini]
MEANRESSLFLVKILEELDSKQNKVSYQDLCKSLCVRFDLCQLAKLRSVLFYTACLDPNFPATLFKDKMRCSVENQQSKKIMIAADIVTIFNLIQMNGGLAKEKLPFSRHRKIEKKELFDSCSSETEICNLMECPTSCDIGNPTSSRGYSIRKSSKCPKADCKSCHQFIPTAEPNFLLAINKELKGRAASLDRLQALASYSLGTSAPCEMQSTYFPMNPENDSISEQDSLPITTSVKDPFLSNHESFMTQSSGQKRSVFKGDFHSVLTISSPTALLSNSKLDGGHREPQARREASKPTFFNHSFEMPHSTQYLNAVYSPLLDKRRVKHESLDDLQASTYFGPSTVLGSSDPKEVPGKQNKQSPWPSKSWSLNTDETPDFERSFFNRKAEDKSQYENANFQSVPEQQQSYLNPQDPTPSKLVSFVGKTASYKAKDVSSPLQKEKPEAMKQFKEKNLGYIDKTINVATQTEQGEQRKGKDLCKPGAYRHGDNHSRKLSEDDSEIISDDISDIFRFLDDMSISGSTGVIQSSCYNSNGSLSQVPKTDGESSPEHNAAKASCGNKPEKSSREENQRDEELKTSICKLVLRIGAIEKKLESLSGVREEISQVLAKLNNLDAKLQQPEKVNVQIGEESLSSDTQSDASAAPRVCQHHSTPQGGKLESKAGWGSSDPSESKSRSLQVKALKKNLFTIRSSRSFTEENSAAESKITSICNSPGEWRTTYSSQTCNAEKDKKDKGSTEGKERARKSKEAGTPQGHKMPKHPKDSFLIEQVFSPHPYPVSLKSHMKSNPLYTDMRLTNITEVKRGQPSWTFEEYTRNSGDKGKLAALELQNQESLNPNNLEYWMEDIYTPGYDSLLKRKEAEFRRAKVCKMTALIAAAACTIILVIVIPICTMKS